MAVINQVVSENYAIYNGDACEVLAALPAGSVHLTIHSPPFAQENGGALYHYSSSPRDLSNARSFAEFLVHYGFVVKELFRLTMPGRMAAVHCADVPTGNSGCDHMFDLPGELIRLYESVGFRYAGRYCVWKEPLAVRNRTLAKNLAHKTIVVDSSKCSNASADYLLIFRRKGENPAPIPHPHGLMEYAGSRAIPTELHRFRGWTGKQTENRYSHWIWRQYASSFWDDVRLDNVLPFRDAKDPDDEKHVHPLQLDVIERACVLWSNPGETVLTPCMGVGSEVYGAVRAGRRGVGVELKPSYFRQAVRNMALVKVETGDYSRQTALAFDEGSGMMDDEEGANDVEEEPAAPAPAPVADVAPATPRRTRPLSAILSDADADALATPGAHSLLVRQDGGQWELAITRLDNESAKSWSQRCEAYTSALREGDRARRYDGRGKCVEAWPSDQETPAPESDHVPASGTVLAIHDDDMRAPKGVGSMKELHPASGGLGSVSGGDNRPWTLTSPTTLDDPRVEIILTRAAEIGARVHRFNGATWARAREVVQSMGEAALVKPAAMGKPAKASRTSRKKAA